MCFLEENSNFSHTEKPHCCHAGHVHCSSLELSEPLGTWAPHRSSRGLSYLCGSAGGHAHSPETARAWPPVTPSLLSGGRARACPLARLARCQVWAGTTLSHGEPIAVTTSPRWPSRRLEEHLPSRVRQGNIIWLELLFSTGWFLISVISMVTNTTESTRSTVLLNKQTLTHLLLRTKIAPFLCRLRAPPEKMEDAARLPAAPGRRWPRSPSGSRCCSRSGQACYLCHCGLKS